MSRAMSDKSEILTHEDCEVDDWTCPNCDHQSPIRTFDILDRQQKKIEKLERRHKEDIDYIGELESRLHDIQGEHQ